MESGLPIHHQFVDGLIMYHDFPKSSKHELNFKSNQSESSSWQSIDLSDFYRNNLPILFSGWSLSLIIFVWETVTPFLNA